ncbi:MAG: EAL domain-containing protein [Steroidobacteraceae bacterium]
MTKILLVDDNATNRKLLVAWLSSEGHLTVEAADGSDGLAAARREKPNLIISDILMPTMDGYEFIRRLRTEPGVGAVAVIFYTANYHEHEARELAEQCGVQRVLVKPSSRGEFLAAVEQALSGAGPQRQPAGVGERFDVEHLRLLTDKLSQKAEELGGANARLSALTSLNVQLSSERDPHQLLRQVCSGARNLLGASYAVLAVEPKAAGRAVIQCHSGLEFGADGAAPLSLTDGLLGEVFSQRRVLRRENLHGTILDTGLPAGFPDAHSALAVPISSLTRTYGWLCLVDKVGADAFSAHDEHLLTILGALVGRVYENGALYSDVLRLNRVYATLSGINSLLVRVADREQLLRESCRIAVEQGGFKAAWCGLTERLAPIAQAAAAGELPPGDEAAHSGRLDIGAHPFVDTALRTRQPVVCNDLAAARLTDALSRALEQHGCRALAALPLIVAGEGVGCLLLMSAEAEVFDRAEMHLLEELGGDISFALDHIDKAERLNYLAYYDSLTGLANRTFLQERLAQHIRGLVDPQALFALVVIDLEQLEWLNDTLGRPGGDEALREFAEQAVRSAGDAGYVARCGADEFALVIPRPQDIMDVTRTVESWLAQWATTPAGEAGRSPSLRVRAGIALFPNDGRDAGALLRSAEAAVKNAKLTQADYAFYTPQLGQALQERRTLESNLRRALENEEFVLYYQPKVDLDARRLAGVEALMRWQHPQRGIVLPGSFIPLMEETGLIVEAGLWALQQACVDRERWMSSGLPAPRVAVNVSSVQLRREDFVRTVADALTHAGPNGGIDIEVTESLLMKDIADNIEKLSRIRALGVGIALDDFGTGYSSLAYLARLPVESIKIDRSFVVAMLDDPSAMTLVSTVISLAHTLRLKTVAEGVESEEQAKILRLLRCDEMQGFLISHPLSFEDMATYLRSAA